jgi:flavin reductase (DIM6/NTAB) family NADH-FMN oxidoreductase RutF
MNILTYATPVSTAPTRVWSLGLFKDTLSEANLRRSGVCVLQLLTDHHKDAVPILGSVSGRDVDKKAVCQQLGLEWEDLKDKDRFQVLPGCASYVKLSIQGGVVDAGSHFIVPFCEVVEMHTSINDNEASRQHLSTGMLRDAGIITEKGRVSESKQYSVSSAYD